MKKNTVVKKNKENGKKAVKKHSRLIAESSRSIERSYSIEKKRIDTAIKELEKERLSSYLDLLEKRKAIVNFKKQKLDELEKSIAKHARSVKKSISRQKKKKVVEKTHFEKLYAMNEHLKKIEAQIKDIVVSRKVLLKKEKALLNDSKRFFNDNMDELQYYGISRPAKIRGILTRKTKILAETAHLLGNDQANIFSDKRVLENITDNQLNKIYNLNSQLKKLTGQHRTLLKKQQELKTEEFEFKQILSEIDNKKKSLQAELQVIK